MAMVGDSCKQIIRFVTVFLMLAGFPREVFAVVPPSPKYPPAFRQKLPIGNVANRSSGVTRIKPAAYNSGCTDPVSWQMFTGRDSPGNDIIGWKITNYPGDDGYKFCVNECAKDCRCKGFNLSPKVNFIEYCWLKFYVEVGSRLTVNYGLNLFVKSAVCTENVAWQKFAKKDSPGNDIQGWIISSLSLGDAWNYCAGVCGKDCNCRGFNLSPSFGQCWLKYSIDVESKLTDTADWDLYVRPLCTQNVAWQKLVRKDSPGYDIQVFTISGLSLGDAWNYCAGLCGKDCSCKGFNFSPMFGECWLKYFIEVESKLTDTPYWDLYVKPFAVDVSPWTSPSSGPFLVISSLSFNAWSAENNRDVHGTRIRLYNYPNGFDNNVGGLWSVVAYNDYYYFQQNTGKCLSVSSSTLGSEVILSNCNRDDSQLWAPIYSTSETDSGYQWQNKMSGNCIDGQGGRIGDCVIQWTCKSVNDGSICNQLWLPSSKSSANADSSPSGLSESKDPIAITATLNVFSRHYSQITNLPASVDWSSYFGPVKDQSTCGACSIFAVVAAIEGAYNIWLGKSVNPILFSEQQILDCFGSCQGGWAEDNLNWLALESGGLATQNDYGVYEGQKSGGCKAYLPKEVDVTRYELTTAQSDSTLMSVLSRQPAVTAMVLTDAFMAWKGWNIFTDSRNDCQIDSQLNHFVTLVGYGTENGVPYWIIRNSFGSGWGQNGYGRIKRGICGVNSLPSSYPVIAAPDSNPCNSNINPCGSGTCVPSSSPFPNAYACRCTSKGYITVKNSDKTETCALLDVCSSTGYNLCGAGSCINDGNGYYHCVCLRGYIMSINNRGKPICAPPVDASSTVPQTYTVVPGDSCYVISYSFGLTIPQLLNQNTNIRGNLCNNLRSGDVLKVANPGASSCKVLYSIQIGDTCPKIEAAFNLKANSLYSLNPGLSCSLGFSGGFPLGIQPGQQICIQKGTPDPTKVCNQVAYVQESDRRSSSPCDSIRARTTKISRLDFFEINRGINCGKFYVGQTVCVASQSVPPSACKPHYKWKRTDTCNSVISAFCGSRSRSSWKACMGKNAGSCVKGGSDWAIGRIICPKSCKNNKGNQVAGCVK